VSGLPTWMRWGLYGVWGFTALELAVAAGMIVWLWTDQEEM
jgi:hypothetical protein